MGSHGLLIVDHGQSVGTHDGYHPRDLRGEAMGHPMSCLPQLSRHGSSRSKLAAVFFAEKGTGRKMESVNAQHILVDSGLFFTWFIQSVSLSDLISLNNFKITNYIFQFEFSRSSPRTYNLPGEKETKRYVLLRTGIQRWEQSVPSPAGQNRRCHCFFFRMRQPSQILS